MKNAKIVFCLFIQIIVHSFSLAQDSLFIFQYPSAKEIDIVVNSIVYLTENGYSYEYEVINLLSSEQDIWTFSVEYENNVLNVNSPVGWEGEILSNIPRISWGSSDSTKDIHPGEKLVGFSYESSGLPFINHYLSSGWVPPPVLEMEPDSIIGGSIDDNSKIGKTLCPKDPPDPFVPTAFLDELIFYKHQSIELGWIDNEGVANSLDVKLENAKKHIEKGQIKPAVNVLNAFINEVEAQNEKHLTSEAYALLKYNAEYLIQKLEEE